jgi:hypothetical protein
MNAENVNGRQKGALRNLRGLVIGNLDAFRDGRDVTRCGVSCDQATFQVLRLWCEININRGSSKITDNLAPCGPFKHTFAPDRWELALACSSQAHQPLQ